MRVPRVAAAILVAILGGSVVAGCSDGQVQRTDGGADQSRYIEGDGAITIVAPERREPAPEFGGPLLGGGEFELAGAAGEVVVLNVWGSWCPPCRQEAPGLQALHEEMGGDGVRFVGVNIRDNQTDALAFEADFGVTFPSVVDATSSRLLAFRDTLPPGAIPSTLVIDREGRMAARVLGAISEASLRGLITDILTEGAGS